MAINYDCVFYKNPRMCKALNDIYCKKEEKQCAFYKSNKEYELTEKGVKRKAVNNG